jgi:Family of unknown function (DUF5752)
VNVSDSNQQFFVKSCSLASIATGHQASSLLELRDKLMIVDESCIYHHFWGARLNPQFIHPQNHNDFANWIYSRLHDHVLAEKLSIIDPTELKNLEALRQEVLEAIENRLDDYEFILWIKKEDRFHFIRSTIIIFDSVFTLRKPEDLPNLIGILPPSSIFYHFIDARTRTSERMDDFSAWLKIFGSQYDPLIKKFQSIDPYFLSLTQLQSELSDLITKYFDGRNIL